MTKPHSNSGFGIVEVLLILVIIGILSFTGWFVYHARQNNDKALTANNSAIPMEKKRAATPTSTPADSYAGWKIATFTGDSLSVKYPSDWQASTDSTTGDALIQKTVGSGKLTVRLGWAAGGLIANAGGNNGYKEISNLTFAGKTAYIVSDKNDTTYRLSSCAAPSLCFFAPRTTSQYKGINEDLEYIVPEAQESPALPNDATFLNEAKKIMSSLAY